MITIKRVFVLLICTFWCVSMAASALDPTDVQISLLPASSSLAPGETAQIAVQLNAAPAGLSGYNVTVQLTDPAVAEIVDVQYPEWAFSPKNNTLPADEVWCKAGDLEGGSGTAEITLLTVTVRADAAGTTNITVLPEKVEDREAGRYTPAVVEAQLQVAGPVQPAVAAFSADVTTGDAPLAVQFTDESTDAEAWAWDFENDGTVDSTEQNPAHTYDAAGTYTVSLTVTNDGGSDDEVKIEYIVVNEGASPVTDFTYTSDGSSITITGYTGAGGDVVIPGEIEGLPVTTIGSEAFRSCSTLTSVTIPGSVTTIGTGAFRSCSALTSVTIGNGVTSIGDYMFRDCTSLTSVTIPDSVTSIGENAFYGCTSLTSVTIPDSVTYIGSSAFSDCTSLTSVTIPDSVTTIGSHAFSDCTSLTSVTIPDSVTYIGSSAFRHCTSLTAIDVDAGNTAYASVDGVLYDKAVSTLMRCPGGKASVTIPDSVTTIGEVAFGSCTSLTSVTIPDSVTTIGEGAFDRCTSLTSVTLGSSVTSIGTNAFYGCPSLTSVTIPDSVTTIGESAFGSCTSLTSIVIPDSVTSIGESAFRDCTSLTSIVIPDSVTTFGNSAFYGCTSLTSIVIPDSVTTFGNSAFQSCTSLTSVTIGSGVTSIGNFAFWDCTSLASMTFEGNAPTVGALWSLNVPTTMIVYYQPGTTGFTNPWNGFTAVMLTSTPVAAFSADVTSGPAPLTVTFTDASTNSPTAWAWDFDNDGTVDSTEQNPAHTYDTAGTYTVNLTVTNAGGSSDDEVKTDYITVTVGENSPYAVEVVDYQGPFGSGWYGDPNAVLGKPSTRIINAIPMGDDPPPTFRIKLVEPAYATDLEGNDVITTLNSGAYITVKFDHQVENDPNNPYGIDLLVFGNAFFVGDDYVSDNSNMDEYMLTSGIFAEPVTVAVSQDNVTWYTFTDGPFADGMFPTHAYQWDSATHSWTDNEMNFTRPVNPYLTVDDFAGLTGAQAIALYDGSGGGTGYDIGALGLDWIQYVRVTSNGGEIDAFADVAPGYVAPWSDFQFTNDGSAVTITGYAGPGGDVVIPGEIEGLPVTTIDDWAFYQNTALTSVTIPDSVTSIGTCAFSGCTSLTSVTLGNGVTSIGASAFYCCDALTSVTIPDSVTSIGGSAFYHCTSLTSVTFGSGLTSYGSGAFSICTSLTTIYVDAENTAYASVDGVLYDKAVTTLIQCPGGKTSVTIPDSVTTIGDRAFNGCTSLSSVTIPDSVTSIGEQAFRDCTSLSSVTIPDSVTSIGDWTFFHCTSLTSVTIPDSVTTIGKLAFRDCPSLTSVTIPDSVTSIGDSAFNECTSLTSVTLGSGVTTIGNNSFQSCAFTSVTIPDSVTSIGSSAFADTALTSVTIPDSVTSIGTWAFAGCDALTSVTLGSGVTTIVECAFQNCAALTSVDFGSGVTTLDKSAFWACTSLTSVTIPDSVTTIGESVFEGCTALTTVTIGNNTATTIGESVFEGCTALTTVTIGEGASIGGSAFRGCTSLPSVTIPDSVTSIGSSAFRDCTSLASVTIPDSVTSIGSYAFRDCTSLTSVDIGSGVTSIGSSMFRGCTSLASVTIPDSVTSIDKYAFRDCTALSSITFNGNAPTVVSSWTDGVPSTMIVYYYPGAAGFTDPWNGFTTVMLTAPGPAPVGLAFAPTPAEADVGGTVEVAIVADAFPAGLAGYNLTVTLNDPSVATITAVSFPEWVGLNATGDRPAGSVFIKAADLGGSVSAGATDVTLATLTLSGVDAGTSSITATVTLMDADDGSAIETAVTDGEIVVPAGAAFPGCESFPHDLNGDGICEDVNGNGLFDFDDIVVFFNAIEWAAANEPAEILDVNDNGRIDFADLVGLYQMI